MLTRGQRILRLLRRFRARTQCGRLGFCPNCAKISANIKERDVYNPFTNETVFKLRSCPDCWERVMDSGYLGSCDWSNPLIRNKGR